MECYYCGSTACPAVATNERNDCLHCSDAAIEHETGVLLYENGSPAPASNASPNLRKGWHDAAMHYSR